MQRTPISHPHTADTYPILCTEEKNFLRPQTLELAQFPTAIGNHCWKRFVIWLFLLSLSLCRFHCISPGQSLCIHLWPTIMSIEKLPFIPTLALNGICILMTESIKVCGYVIITMCVQHSRLQMQICLECQQFVGAFICVLVRWPDRYFHRSQLIPIHKFELAAR